MRLLVVVVVTVALLVAAAPIALTQAPRLHSPLLAVVAFGVAVIALIAGIALLVRATLLHRRPPAPAAVGPRREALRARVVPAPRSGSDRPVGDDAETEPRRRSERILLVPAAGRVTVSTGASPTGPRHALADEPGQSRQDPDTTGQSPAGPSQIHAQQSSGGSATDRSAAFARRYTATRSRR